MGGIVGNEVAGADGAAAGAAPVPYDGVVEGTGNNPPDASPENRLPVTLPYRASVAAASDGVGPPNAAAAGTVAAAGADGSNPRASA